VCLATCQFSLRKFLYYINISFTRRACAIWPLDYVSPADPSQIQPTKNYLQDRSRIWGRVSTLWWSLHINLSNYHYQIYKSRWSLSKCLYLACRFGILLCWPIVMYSFMFDHDVESCKPFLVIVSVLLMLFVRPAFFVTHKFTVNFTLPTKHASLNVYMSSVHVQSLEQNAGHCSSIYPASLPTSLLSFGILWAEYHFGKKSF